ncbi:MAG: hypothetical protein Q9224_006982 [Gallowayella concinna]
MAALRIASAPFRPSLLRNNYIPRSPASPLESVAKRPLQKKSKRGKKKARSCQSQFDYTGWQAWGAWKRSQLDQDGQAEDNGERNCVLVCDWPSQCRWSRQQGTQEEHTCPDHLPEPVVAAPETVAAPDKEETVTETPKAADSLISKIGTATQKLTSHWSSMLSPIEEESSSPDIAAIEDFLRSAKTKTQPTTASEKIDVPRHDSSISHDLASIAPLQIVKKTVKVAERPHPDSAKQEAKHNIFRLDLDFDFGFPAKKREEGAVPSLTDGLKDLVAGTVGIALSTPARGKRCVSEPPALSQVKGQRVKRRSSN